MNRIPVEQFVSELVEECLARGQAHEDRRKRLGGWIERITSDLAQARSDLLHRTALASEVGKAGLSTSQIESQMVELESSCKKFESDLAAAKAELAESEKEMHDPSWLVQQHFQALFERNPHVEAIRVVDVGDLIRTLRIEWEDPQEDGRPSIAKLALGPRSETTVPISAGSRVLASHVPASLRWLVPDRPNRQDQPFLAVHLLSTGARLLSSAAYHEARSYPPGASAKVSLSHLATELAVLLQEHLPTDEAIRHDADYPLDSAAAALQERLLAATTDRPRFLPCSVRLPSPEIERTIAPHWRAFVDCPWHSDIRGDLALFKHLAELGDKPKFWNEPVEGLFGFRLRTRDHDWLVGQVFVDSQQQGETSDQTLLVLKDRYPNVARLGGIALRVEREK